MALKIQKAYLPGQKSRKVAKKDSIEKEAPKISNENKSITLTSSRLNFTTFRIILLTEFLISLDLGFSKEEEKNAGNIKDGTILKRTHNKDIK